MSNRYYGNSETALKYFKSIRAARGVMPDLVNWEKDFPVDAQILDVGFGPAIEFEFLLEKVIKEQKKYSLQGLDLSEPQKNEAERLFDEKFGAVWRQNAQLFLKSLQDFEIKPESFDRIWASAVFLHLDKDEMISAISKYGSGLKKSGEMYINFKIGDGPTRADEAGRPFSYYTEELFRNEVMAKLPGLRIKRVVPSTQDSLGRPTAWLNLILERTE